MIRAHVWRRTFAMLAAAALVAGCTSDDDAGGGGKGNGTTPDRPAEVATLASGVAVADATTGGVEGCGDEAVGEIDDESPDHQPARCEPGFPAPAPLAERATVKVALNFRVAGYSPILLGEHLGEFDKENIDVEIVEMPSVDALPLLAKGDIDLVTSAPEASLYSAVNQGLDLKLIMGANYSPSAGDFSIGQQGIWARADAFSDPANPDLAELKGKTIGSAVGFTSVIMWPIERALNEAGISLTDVRVEQIPGDATVQALENDAIQAAWVLDPHWQNLVDNDDFILIATAPPGAQLGAYAAGPSLLEDNRDVGVAFVRALIRTISTYYVDGYPTEDDVVEAMAEVLDQPVDAVRNTSPSYMDWEIRDWVVEGPQETFLTLGELPYSDPIPVEDLVDRTIYLDAIGAK